MRYPSKSHFAEFIQIGKFGGVGALATLVHVLVFTVTMEMKLVGPLVGNTLAFGIALSISYLGHAFWTFGRTASSLPLFVRHAVVACCGFLVNSCIVFVVIEMFASSYWIATIAMLSITPTLSYVLLRLWVFKEKHSIRDSFERADV